jgi:excisionase family DNA binding protein
MVQNKLAPPDVVATDTASVKISRKAYSTIFQNYPDVLDVKHVTELLGVSSKTVYRLLNEGTLDSLKVGRAFKIPKLYLLQYIKVGYTQQQG